MREFEAGGTPHRTIDLCAYAQFRLLRSTAPVLPALLALDVATTTLDAEVIASALSDVDPVEITHAFDAAAASVEREVDGVWGPATKAIPLPDMLTIVLAIVEDNFGAYLARRKPDFRPAMGRRSEFEPVTMPDGESWFFRPCQSTPPLLDMLSLYDGRAKIEHVFKANDLLDVQAENDHRAFKASERRD